MALPAGENWICAGPLPSSERVDPAIGVSAPFTDENPEIVRVPALSTYTRPPFAVTLIGCVPPEATRSVSVSASPSIAKAEMSLLPALTAARVAAPSCHANVIERCHRANMLGMATAAERARILVVDDDPKILELVRMYLEREGLSVITASDGIAALAAIRERAPRAVVLDLMLPGLDGLAVIRAARADSSVPILMLSARGATADRISGIATRADDYLPKPFS